MTGRASPSSDERLAALHDKLITAVADLVHSDRWRQMLTAAARFPTYSPSNVLLIAAQRPEATHVAGIRTWNNLGRRVAKGEHGIAILAPLQLPLLGDRCRVGGPRGRAGSGPSRGRGPGRDA